MPVDLERDTRGAILHEALGLFCTQGYDGASMRSLAEALDIKPAALYYHFPSKREILLSIVQPFLDDAQALLDEADVSDTRGQRNLLGAVLDLMLEHRQVVSLLARDVTAVRQRGIGEELRRQATELTLLLTGPEPDEDRLIRASSAFGALRRPVLDLPDLDLMEHRSTILSAAYGALGIRPGSAQRRSAA